MNINYLYILFAWIVTALLLIIFIPRDKLREALVAFLFMQLLTGFLGLTVAERKLIDYPVRLFPYATKANFSFEYFIYPAVSAVFNVHFPQSKGRSGRLLYYVCYCTAITVIEVLVEKYTDIIECLNWAWYASWITLFLTLYISRRCYVWFFRLGQNRGS